MAIRGRERTSVVGCYRLGAVVHDSARHCQQPILEQTFLSEISWLGFQIITLEIYISANVLFKT